MNASEALLLLAAIKSVYQHQEVSQLVADTWAAVLPEISFADAMRAARTYMRDEGNVYPPKPSQILSILVQEQLGSSLIPDDAWSEVMAEVKRIGLGRHRPGLTRQFSDPLIERAVQSIGWDVICLSEIDNLPTVRAQFIRSLTAKRDHQRRAVTRGAGQEPALPAERTNALPPEVPR